MTTQQEHYSPTLTPSASPSLHRDPSLLSLSKHSSSKHATQLLPVSTEYRIGHGDPLLQAALQYRKLVAAGGFKSIFMGKEIHLKDTGTLFGGVGLKDVVHVSEDDVIEFPCLPVMTNDDVCDDDKHETNHTSRTRRTEQCSMPNMSEFLSQMNDVGDKNDHPIVHLLKHDTTFAGMGINDIVHLDANTVVSVPCIPSPLLESVRKAKRQSESGDKRRDHVEDHHGGHLDHLDDHGSLVAGLGLSDVVHFLVGED
jgi:hypothetical protein